MKLIFGALLLISIAVGGVRGFPMILRSLTSLIVTLGVVAVGVLIVFVLIKRLRSNGTKKFTPQSIQPNSAPAHSWTERSIAQKLHAIDWYQFEKTNAAILRKEGWLVERKGGATPDGGVDLVAIRGETRMLVQCKHWKTWKVQEKVIRELLGSMTHFGVSVGALHTLKGWTEPAATFAATHGIQLSDENDLASRARAKLTDAELGAWLLETVHHCPKCESVMILRTGDFKSFWGCSTYPRCRGVLRET